MRILELFAGIGACSKALERLGIDVEIVDAVEIDKYAIKSFNAIHGTGFEVQDIKEWDKDIRDIDLITHGSPCQDFSVAGKQAGGDLGSGTRSSLMYETIRIVGKIRPKYVLWENVKNILSKKHKHNFDSYIETMNILGYNSYYQVLNAKDYGIPQNRERVYTVSIRKDILVYDDYNSSIREDQDTIGTLTTNCGNSASRNGWKIIEMNQAFKFPEKEELKVKLKDMLEDEVEEKYYLSDNGINYFYKQALNRGEVLEEYKDKRIITVAHGQSKGSNKELELSPTLDTQFSNNWRGVILEPKLLIKNATKKGYDEAIEGDSINLQHPNSKTRRGRVGHQASQTIQCNDSMGVVEKINKNAKHQQDLVQSQNGVCRVIPAGTHGSTPHLLKTIVNENPLRIRKLTPKECWRLMRL